MLVKRRQPWQFLFDVPLWVFPGEDANGVRLCFECGFPNGLHAPDCADHYHPVGTNDLLEEIGIERDDRD